MSRKQIVLAGFVVLHALCGLLYAAEYGEALAKSAETAKVQSPTKFLKTGNTVEP